MKQCLFKQKCLNKQCFPTNINDLSMVLLYKHFWKIWVVGQQGRRRWSRPTWQVQAAVQLRAGTLPRRWRRTSPTLTSKWQRLLCATSAQGQARNQGWKYGLDQVKPIESRGSTGLSRTVAWSKKGIQGSLRQERKDGGKVWGAGKSGAQKSSKSPRKLSFQTKGVGSARGGPRLTSLLMLSASTSLQLACHARQALVISDFPIFPPPVPRDGSQTSKVSRRFRTPLPRLPASARIFKLVVQLLIKSLMRRRWCERLALSSASSQGRLRHLSSCKTGIFAHAVGFSRSHACTHQRPPRKIEQLRQVFLSIWDHSSI